MTHTAEPMTLEQVRDALVEDSTSWRFDAKDPQRAHFYGQLADAIDAELAKQREAEPKAWAVLQNSGNLLCCENEASARLTAKTYGYKLVPLYTHPQQRNAVEVTLPDPKAWFTENDEAIATLAYRNLGEELGDKLTFERSPAMFPQATYSLCRAAVGNFIVAVLEKYSAALSAVASRDREDAEHYTNAFKVFAEAFGAPLEASKFQNLRPYKFQHTNDLWIAWRKAFPSIDAALRENKS